MAQTSLTRLAASFVLVGVVFASGLGLGAAVVAHARTDDPYAGLDTLARALTTIERRYVDEVALPELVEHALEGAAEGLDPHSRYLDPETMAAFREDTEGEYSGVGLELVAREGRVRVRRVIPGGPADLAGFQRFDAIARIDGADMSAATVDDVAEALRGERGQVVHLAVERGGAVVEADLARDTVIDVSVEGERGPGDIAYIRISHFQRRTTADFDGVWRALLEEGPVSGIVLDLRENPGGLLDEAVGVVDRFLGDVVVVSTRGRSIEEEVLRARKDEGDIELPVAVLIDGASASASEIVAGALQHHGRAVLVGAPSYGKGSVQEVFGFEDGAALKLTVGRYLVGGERPIPDQEGLTPDVAVPLSDDDLGSRLASALEHDQELAREAMERLREQGEGAVDWYGTLDERLDRDPQLKAAWDSAKR